MKCEGCGAYVAPEDEKCKYCGTRRDVPQEILIKKQQEIVEEDTEDVEEDVVDNEEGSVSLRAVLGWTAGIVIGIVLLFTMLAIF